MYLYETEEDVREMLEAIGVASMEDLFAQIPSSVRLERPLEIPGPLGELELQRHMRELADNNVSPSSVPCFLGAGAYDHFIPEVVNHIASRSEFYTSYTPYQPEVSQGNLQATFEYQTLICQLTGMDVSNASLYEGGSATAEAVLMAMSQTRRYGRVVLLRSVHPEFRQIVATYVRGLKTRCVEVGWGESGAADPEAVASELDDETACLVVQHPNFFGALEEVETLAEIAHARGVQVVHIFDPISLGILRRPGEWGADLAVAEGQSLGTPLQYGGPYLGILACRERFLRRLPGRLAGQTVDRRGRRCWVLTLQTREQHIRREKATSNICTNQGLFALRAAVYLSLMGPRGLREVARQCVQKTAYARDAITAGGRYELLFAGPTFKEFAVRDRQGDVSGALKRALDGGILAGLPLDAWYPELADGMLVAVTEKRTRVDIDRWAELLQG